MPALILVALVAFTPALPASTNDDTRLALTQQLIDHGTTQIDPLSDTTDVSRYRGHHYTNRAPGMSLWAIPAVAIAQGIDDLLGIHHRRVNEGPWHRWLLRLSINGVLLLAVVWLLGRVSEGLRAGTGAAVAVVTGTGTLLAPLSMVMFEEVGAGLLLFGGFLLAWRRSYVWSGVAAGSAVVWQYPSALVTAAIGLYALSFGWRPLLRFAIGTLPAVVVFALYHLAAFGAPWRVSTRYTVSWAAENHSGFFGISLPSYEDFRAVLIGGSRFELGSGLLVRSPVAIAAGVGLLLLFRRGFRREATLCLLATALFVVLDAGYFAPYGGTSPGPRYLAPALPFLFLGLCEALHRWPLPTVALSLLSIGLMTKDSLAWDRDNHATLPDTVWSLMGSSQPVGVAFVAAAALAAGIFVVLVTFRFAGLRARTQEPLPH